MDARFGRQRSQLVGPRVDTSLAVHAAGTMKIVVGLNNGFSNFQWLATDQLLV